MGGMYARTYFPTGYSEWVSDSKIEDLTDEPMSQALYDIYAIQYRDQIKEIAQHYDKCEQQIKTDMDKFISDNKSFRISVNRIIYDHLIGKRICDFWIELIEQPRESVKFFYKENRPKIEPLFYQIEKDYGLTDKYPADQTIWAYKQYAS